MKKNDIYYTKILQEEYEKKYKTQKYIKSILHGTFEDVLIKAMRKSNVK